jgi:Protein of unknown function (DUF664)
MIAADAPRVEPDRFTDEPTMVAAWLDYHRATLTRKCAGLSDGQLRARACPPSGLTLLGLIRHMTEVERAWFGRRMAGRTHSEVPPLYSSDDDPDGDFDQVDAADAAQAFEAFGAAVRVSRAVLDGQDLDRACGSGDRAASVRWICLHMIEEYARHNGHADLLREAIDGETGE